MKIIFLDIDGVLNCRNSKASCHGIMGIDDERPKISWNFGTIWNPDEFRKFLKDSCENMKNDDYDGDRC